MNTLIANVQGVTEMRLSVLIDAFCYNVQCILSFIPLYQGAHLDFEQRENMAKRFADCVTSVINQLNDVLETYLVDWTYEDAYKYSSPDMFKGSLITLLEEEILDNFINNNKEDDNGTPKGVGNEPVLQYLVLKEFEELKSDWLGFVDKMSTKFKFFTQNPHYSCFIPANAKVKKGTICNECKVNEPSPTQASPAPTDLMANLKELYVKLQKCIDAGSEDALIELRTREYEDLMRPFSDPKKPRLEQHMLEILVSKTQRLQQQLQVGFTYYCLLLHQYFLA